MNRELALKLDDGTVIRDIGWRCISDVMHSFHGFSTDRRVYGVIVDAETLVQVCPEPQLMDGTATKND